MSRFFRKFLSIERQWKFIIIFEWSISTLISVPNFHYQMSVQYLSFPLTDQWIVLTFCHVLTIQSPCQPLSMPLRRGRGYSYTSYQSLSITSLLGRSQLFTPVVSLIFQVFLGVTDEKSKQVFLILERFIVFTWQMVQSLCYHMCVLPHQETKKEMIYYKRVILGSRWDYFRVGYRPFTSVFFTPQYSGPLTDTLVPPY